MSTSWSIAVLGAGAWGTALALTMQRAGHRTTLWARDPNLVREINDTHANSRYLPGVTIDPRVLATDDLAAAVSEADCVLAAIPAQHPSAVLASASNVLAPDVPVVLCAKGIERETGRLMSEAAREALRGNPLAALRARASP